MTTKTSAVFVLQTNSGASSGAIEINHSIAADDSCQLMLYAKGHHEDSEFIQACRAYLKRWDGRLLAQRHCDPIRRLYWRTVRAPSDNIVCDVMFKEASKGRGAYPVTVLDRWLPL